jgi:hypothetical protein
MKENFTYKNKHIEKLFHYCKSVKNRLKIVIPIMVLWCACTMTMFFLKSLSIVIFYIIISLILVSFNILISIFNTRESEEFFNSFFKKC